MRQRTSRRQGIAAGILLALGVWLGLAPAAAAQEQLVREQQASVRLEHLAAGYRPAGTLGFRLRETPIEEQLYRRADSGETAVLWSAQFTSRWQLTDDQLDRWSAQVIGLLADSLAAEGAPALRLASYERLAASEVGERRIAYRYALATASGQPAGEATLVVFARGAQVGLTGAAALGTTPPFDAVAVARALDAALATPTLAARVN
jgi:hypothetical protein